MTLETSLPALLATLTQSLTSALTSTPEASLVIPPKEGISLLDAKNELLLSYLQNLVFLIILKLRNRKSPAKEEENGLEESVVKKLVELRVYLEKGIRPLEGRLKYQIDKVLRAADDAAREATKTNKTAQVTGESSDDDDHSGGSDTSEDGPTNGVTLKASEINDLQYRPNPSAFTRPSSTIASDANYKRSSLDGVYKPPRITPTAMPTTGPREKESRKPVKSATLDEFIHTEMSSAPLAEPSIGSTIVSGGRRSKTEQEKKEEAERREYEERNYTRLPKQSKKERAKKKAGRQNVGYGGEEWGGLGAGIDRIERLTKRNSAGRTVLEKSRKRLTEDGPRGSGSGGVEVGEGFQKRLKALDGKRRDRGRR